MLVYIVLITWGCDVFVSSEYWWLQKTPMMDKISWVVTLFNGWGIFIEKGSKCDLCCSDLFWLWFCSPADQTVCHKCQFRRKWPIEPVPWNPLDFCGKHCCWTNISPHTFLYFLPKAIYECIFHCILEMIFFWHFPSPLNNFPANSVILCPPIFAFSFRHWLQNKYGVRV